MKNQSPLFLAASERARSPFLWALALRVRQQSQHRAGLDYTGPVPEAVMEFSRRQFTSNNDDL